MKVNEREKNLQNISNAALKHRHQKSFFFLFDILIKTEPPLLLFERTTRCLFGGIVIFCGP